MDSSRKDANY